MPHLESSPKGPLILPSGRSIKSHHVSFCSPTSTSLRLTSRVLNHGQYHFEVDFKYLWASINRGPQNRPKYIMVLIVGATKMGAPNLLKQPSDTVAELRRHGRMRSLHYCRPPALDRPLRRAAPSMNSVNLGDVFRACPFGCLKRHIDIALLKGDTDTGKDVEVDVDSIDSYFWLFEGGFKASSGTVEWNISNSDTDFEIPYTIYDILYAIYHSLHIL